MKNQAIRRESQSGNVLFIILIGIALFVALSLVMTQTSRVTSGSTSGDRANLDASDIMAYGNAVRQAVQKLLINGCTIQQISFDNTDSGTMYFNGFSPSDKHCNVFDANGGGVVPTDPPISSKGVYAFWGAQEVKGVGTDCGALTCTEIIMFGRDISKDVCQKINDSLGISGMPLHSSISSNPWTGNPSYYGNTIGAEAGDTALIGKSSGCLSLASSKYVSYQVLIAR